ncbi:class I SAM-dependent DNA methyltransferase [Gottfriedia acidiceleris]|uniref:class I SAM-dependent DNA methyltransferase n=1 Tax=Gottfriedia acidiceleris TaxID=371036 RepID=UPI000B4334D4|nr:class I SAM-dependent DNA methyltransferase [Gottfriedia acidiceleris]
MVTSASVKNKVDAIWNIFYSNGVNNPLTAIEQMTYMLFIQGLDELQQRKEAYANDMSELLGEVVPIENPIFITKEEQRYRWSNLKNMSNTEELYMLVRDEVFTHMKKLGKEEDRGIANHLKHARLEIQDPSALSRIISEVDELVSTIESLNYHQEDGDADTLGDLYEYLLMKIETAGRNGQFRTPAHIRNLMVELMKPTPEDTICDPSVGTAGFLVSSLAYLLNNYRDIFTDPEKEEQKNRFYHDVLHGIDNDITMVRIAAMNLYLHGIEAPNISYGNSLSKENKVEGQYSLIIANPPFKGTVDAEVIASDLTDIVPLTTSTKKGKDGKPSQKISKAKTELLFLALILRMLKIGGRAAVIVPDGVLFGGNKAPVSVRKEIIDNHKLEAVISMPSGVFKPYAGVSTAILIFTKTNHGGTNKVWFYDMLADGYTLDDKRSPISENDIPDILSRFENLNKESDRNRADQSFFVPVSEIRENGYDLNINRYKETIYEEVQYDDPKKIISDIKNLQNNIFEGLKRLEDIIG